jgi:hypothetical protein
LGIGQLRRRHGVAALGGIGDPRDSHAGRVQLAFGLHHRGLGDIDGSLVVARIDAHQHISGFHRLVVEHRHLHHVARDLGRDGADVAIDIGVIRRYTVAEVHIAEVGRDCRDYQ